MKQVLKTSTAVTLIIIAIILLPGFTKWQTDILPTSQKDLDMANTVVKTLVTGAAFGDASIAHDGRDISPDSSFRDVYSNLAKAKGSIKPGTIFTKRAYIKKQDGSKGELEIIFAMIKQKKGYFPDGGDWEYVVMPYNKNTDYKSHPNGMLPQKQDGQGRGKLSACGDCHNKAAGNDYVFTN